MFYTVYGLHPSFTLLVLVDAVGYNQISPYGTIKGFFFFYHLFLSAQSEVEVMNVHQASECLLSPAVRGCWALCASRIQKHHKGFAYT